MIDIHNHILPGIDDGAKTIEESVNMIKNAFNVGVTDIIVTPHFILNSSYETPVEKQKQLLSELKNRLKEENIDVNLYLGNEVFVEPNLVELLNKNMFNTLNGSRYLLFELPMNNFYQGIYNLLFELKSAGIEPIIAHPERYSYIQEDPEIAFKLVSHGALLQLDSGSYYGAYGKGARRVFTLLLKHRLASIASTDSHHDDDIYYAELPELFDELEKIVSKNELNRLFHDNALKIINDEPIEKVEVIPLKKGVFGSWK